ncbi:MAG: type II CRISPR RNA-guided endonuclease Cas9 [Bacteroidetes bacterium HGW-Bacteroidetes-1]|jgi:CRISPR-associated endonuclease Csn1|nr:MAG: type II CRISPR RNA-guided endonuclease Cas9 [Bacteroidetes bacterium HGW-Bacteroidetes-1]
MKKILGLDLGTNSIGWALVNEAENNTEQSSIVKLGVRVNPLTVDEQSNFERGKSITTTADRTLKRSMRRNLQRYKLRRENLIEILRINGLVSDDTTFSENGNRSTFETYRLRARAATEEISLSEFARVLLMINKKRGYKSSRKAKNQEEGQLIDGMGIAKKLYDENLTPGQLVLGLLLENKKHVPDFYRSDLISEFGRVWNFQSQFYPEIFTKEFRNEIEGKGQRVTSAAFWKKFGFNIAENKNTRDEKRLQAYKWRSKAIDSQLLKEEAAYVITEINTNLNSSSGYLGSISDRSKELYFNKLTVGQYLMSQLEMNSHTRLKNQVFYRQDYLDEFDVIWEKQSTFHEKLTPELKHEVRNIIIFYQRRLKSQKGLIGFCEFENRQIEILVDGKKKKRTVGFKVCPKSSPLFQEFKIWQILNNLEVFEKNNNKRRLLDQEEKDLLFKELTLKNKLTKADVLKLLFANPIELDLNYKEIEGNRTQAVLFEAYFRIIELTGHGEFDFSKMNYAQISSTVKSIFTGLNYNTDILFFNSELEGIEFERQAAYKFWHLLYSYEGDDSKTGNEKLVNKITELFGFEKEYAVILANVSFQQDYGSLSSKAIRKILPYLKAGNDFSEACKYAGYRHSKSSLTKEELDTKVLKDKLEILPKNSLRNPVVEKIINQMINVVNTVVDAYGKPDEIRIELARELKKSAKEREDLTNAINIATIEHEKYRAILQSEFGISNVSRNDIIRYKLYLELESRGFKTLYTNTYIAQEKLFSKEFDIEHIIPQSRLFDDSFSNKTIETRAANIDKGNYTAYEYVLAKYGQNGLIEYLDRLEELYKAGKISRGKYNKLKMKGEDIPDDFIARDLRDSQYIAKKAKAILEELVKEVISTTGSITDRLREDWQLIDVMQELNWGKFEMLGMTETIENRDGHKIRRIKDWTKRNDHRHHAMDALTIAFTKRSFIQYLNNLNARSDKAGSIYGIEQKELYRDERGKLKFKPPIPLNDFRYEAKKHLENTLISIKAKNKVATININETDKKNGTNKKKQLTPRGQLHLETVYGSIKRFISKMEKVGSAFNEEKIATVAKKSYRIALLKRLIEFDKDPKKAFTGKNSLDKNPLYLNDLQTLQVPEKIKTVGVVTIYTIRKDITPDLKIEKVIDKKIRELLQVRLNEFGGDSKKAFSNLDENPIWLNEEKGISIKRVTITGINNAVALHDKRDKDGVLILDTEGKKQAVDFVNTGNNHHVAIYNDDKGILQENVVSFFEATMRVNQGLPIIDKDYRKDEGWEFLFSMKQNEYFVFPNEKTGFNPKEIDLLDSKNYFLISPNLFRVQKISTKNYVFNHHLETKAVDGDTLKSKKYLIGITHYFIQTPTNLKDLIKVRVNHCGNIVSVGE